ncbi:MAG: phage virion morphogenesis protein [Marinifilaceae bacterium]
MDIKTFKSRLITKQKEVAHCFNRTLPVKVGVAAQQHFRDNFRQGGFVNNGLHPWQPAKRLSTGNKDAHDNYGTLLSGRNALYNAIEYIPKTASVLIANRTRYAAVHNSGGITNPTVTPKLRKFAWHKYYEQTGIKKGMNSEEKKALVNNASNDAKMWKAIALTKKSKLQIKMPKRQFIGESHELNIKINGIIKTELFKILK